MLDITRGVGNRRGLNLYVDGFCLALSLGLGDCSGGLVIAGEMIGVCKK